MANYISSHPLKIHTTTKMYLFTQQVKCFVEHPPCDAYLGDTEIKTSVYPLRGSQSDGEMDTAR